MKPLEDRVWFGLLSLSISLALMSMSWIASGLPVAASAAIPFLFAASGLSRAIGKFLALALIRYDSRWGDVG